MTVIENFKIFAARIENNLAEKIAKTNVCGQTMAARGEGHDQFSLCTYIKNNTLFSETNGQN